MKRKLIAEFKGWYPWLGDEYEFNPNLLCETRSGARGIVRSEKEYFPTARVRRVSVQVFEEGK